VVPGTTFAALTNVNGNYTIAGVPSGTHTLRASRVGYGAAERTVTVAAGQAVTSNFTLVAQAVELEGIVAVGYGTARRRDVTGAVASVDVDQIKTGVTASVAQVLQGHVPGVQITQASAEPGGGVSVRIRGSGSINADNEPLYVIDGLPISNVAATPGAPVFNTRPRNPLNALSPDDIESIEVLKDASATAIYGSRGANGVILITTKRGRAGGLNVEYEGYMGYQAPTRQLEMLGAVEYMALLNDLRRDQREAPEFTPEEMAAVGRGVNWQEEIFRSAPVTNHHLSLSGGGDSHRFYASLSAFDQEGVTISSGTTRYTARMNVEQNAVGDRLKIGLNLNASFINDDNVPLGTVSNEAAGIITSAIYQDPTMSILDGKGRYEQSTLVNVENPLGLAREVDDFARTNRTFGNAFAEYDLLEGLRAKVNLGTDRQAARRDFYMTTNTRRGAEQSGLAQVGSNERTSALAEFTLNYNREVGDDHRIDLLGGSTYQTFSAMNLLANAETFVSDAFRSDNLAAGDRATFDVGSNRNRNQLLSYLGRANYTLLDRYLLTVSFRADGSSRFGAERKFGYFPSAALGWRVSDEDFMQAQDLVSDLKLRVSYGITGNQEIGNYNSLVLLGVTGRAYFDETPHVGISPTQVPNPELKWETTRQFDVGMDFGFLENRVTGSADYFIKNTSDLLLNLPIPATTGFGVMLQNVGAVRNHGWELALNTDNLTGDFGWTTRFNASSVRNRVTDLAGLPMILQGQAGFTREFTILREGTPLNSYYGYIVDGIFQREENIAQSPQPEARPGELKYRDVNGDGKITPDDRTVLGSPFPDLAVGLGNTLSYGPLELDAFIQGSFGNEIINLNRIESENPISFRRNRLRESYTDRWTPQNPTNKTPSGIPVRVAYGGVVNSRAVEDASYVRLRNVELRYQLPTSRLGLRSAAMFISGQNLWTLTGYSGFDPEVSSFGDSNLVVDYSAYPNARTVTAGMRVGL
ncbi:MAG: TonB-dependent receptor, partial [Gemmatimonadetes bacterium]|nr:TonB-dependent receptor [Gemmatimonadota bacterium]